MPEFLTTAKEKAVDFFKNMSKKTKILLGIALIAIVAVSALIAFLLNRVDYAVLYSELSASEAGSVMTILEEKGVDAKTSGTDTILVPADQRDDLIVELAASGYPETGLTYDIFNSSDLGSTDAETQTLTQYQLQENLRTTISTMEKVQDCTVLVSLASSSSYVQTGNATPASAAVVLSLEDDVTLSNQEAQIIGNILLGSIPKITMENIKITDTNMTYYNLLEDDPDTSDEETNLDSTATQIELTEQMKSILKEQVAELIGTAVGKDNLAVSVGLTLDFDNKSVSSVEFEPPVDGEDGGIVRSSEEIREALYGDDAMAEGSAGTDSNGVSASEYVTDQDGNQTSYSATDTFNYEINEIQTRLDRVGAKIDKLSVSVLVNSNIEGMDDTENLQKIQNLAADAIGVDDDYVSVETMTFLDDENALDWEDYQQAQKDALNAILIRDLVKTGIIILAVLGTVFMVLRFLHKRKQNAQAELALAGAGQYIDTLLDDNGNPMGISPEEENDLLQNLMENKPSEMERVEAIVEKYPEVAAQIVRTWLNDD